MPTASAVAAWDWIVGFRISFPPCVDVLGNDSLAAAVINVDVSHDLLPAAPHSRERFHLPLRCAQELYS